jgi:mannose-6-phosphate isomerase-like protein (cupin superfamily)
MATVEPKRVPKGWGEEIWFVNKPEYCGKLLRFDKNKRCSWHYHLVKDETFNLLSGKLELKYGFDQDINEASILILNPGDCFHIPVTLCHQMYAIEPSELLEFSMEHKDEDSIRVIKGD